MSCLTNVHVYIIKLFVCQVGENGIISRGQTIQGAATYRSQYEVQCDIPLPQSYAIKISNDRVSTSLNEALFVVYNSQCFTCQVGASSPDANCTTNVSPLFSLLYFSISYFFMFVYFVSNVSTVRDELSDVRMLQHYKPECWNELSDILNVRLIGMGIQMC